jgi:hypothetical protein
MTDEQLLHKVADIIYDDSMRFDDANYAIRQLFDKEQPKLFQAVKLRQKEARILELNYIISEAQKEIDVLKNT